MCCAVSGKAGGPSLAALAEHLEVRAGAEAHVADAERDELCDAHAGLDRGQQQRVVAPFEPGGPVGGAEQRFDLVEAEVADGVVLVAFEWDRDLASDRVKVLGVAKCDVPCGWLFDVVARRGAWCCRSGFCGGLASCRARRWWWWTVRWRRCSTVTAVTCCRSGG
jgi:hypothetical protein